jgi:hypothetical protein
MPSTFKLSPSLISPISSHSSLSFSTPTKQHQLTYSFLPSTESATQKVKEVAGISTGEAKGKAAELKGTAKGKAHEIAGEAKGKTEEIKRKM